VTDRTENDALIQYATEHAKPDVLAAVRGDANAAPVAYVPKGMELKSLKGFLDQYLPTPERRKGSTQLADIDSFCAFVNRHKGAATVIFATPGDHPSLTCVFDHDPEGPNDVAAYEPPEPPSAVGPTTAAGETTTRRVTEVAAVAAA
jgi:hypothetical protein